MMGLYDVAKMPFEELAIPFSVHDGRTVTGVAIIIIIMHENLIRRQLTMLTGANNAKN